MNVQFLVCSTLSVGDSTGITKGGGLQGREHTGGGELPPDRPLNEDWSSYTVSTSPQ